MSHQTKGRSREVHSNRHKQTLGPLPKYRKTSFTLGTAADDSPGSSNSHIQTIPSLEEESQETPPRRSTTPVFKKISFAAEVAEMNADKNSGAMPAQTLANTSDGTTFAAKARQAELNASRMKKIEEVKPEDETPTAITTQAPTSYDSLPLSSYVVLKSRHTRGRKSTTSTNLPEARPTILSENIPPVFLQPSPTQVITPTTQSLEQLQASGGLEGVTIQSLSPIKTIAHSQGHLSGPVQSPLISSHQISPHSSPPHLTESETAHPTGHQSTFESVFSEIFNTRKMAPRRRASPSISASDEGKSRKVTSRPPSASTKMNEPTRDQPNPRQTRSTMSFNPNLPVFQPRSALQPSDQGTSVGTSASHVNTAFGQPAHMQSLEDPFNEQSRNPSSTYFKASTAYDQRMNLAQQSEYGQRTSSTIFPQGSSSAQRTPFTAHSSSTQHTPYPAQSPYSRTSRYSQHPAYDYPSYGQSAYSQHPAYDQSSHAQSSTPQYTERGDMSSVFWPQGLGQASSTNPRVAVRMPPPAVKGTPTYDSRVTLLQSMANEQQMRDFYNSDPQHQQQILDAEFGPQQSSNTMQDNSGQTKKFPQDLLAHANARQGGQQSVAPTHIRDPAPYTGFSSASKETMLRNTSQTQGGDSTPTRTVLHDPLAHTSAKKPSSELSASTVKAATSDSRQSSTSDEAALEHDLVSSVERFIGKSPPVSLLQPVSSAEFLTTGHVTASPKVFTGQAGFTSSQSPVGEINKYIKGKEALPKISRFFPPKMETKYTFSGLPIPHEGFADFKTPYGVTFGKPSDYKPSNDTSLAAGNVMIKKIAQDGPERTGTNLQQGVGWFHSADRYRDVKDVATDLAARASSMGLVKPRVPASQNTTPQGKIHPTPIGHERSSATKSSGKKHTTSSLTTPSHQATADLMSGVLANLMRYADGSGVGDGFTRWARPAEWVVDRSPAGNKSFFGGGFEAAPQRVARDPRYQQTMTADGRATYFEDPGRMKAQRHWGMH